MTAETEIEGLPHELAPQIVVRLVRRYGDFDSCVLVGSVAACPDRRLGVIEAARLARWDR